MIFFISCEVFCLLLKLAHPCLFAIVIRLVFLPEILHTKKQEKNNQSPHLVWLLIVVGTHFVKVHTFMGIAEYAEVIQHA